MSQVKFLVKIKKFVATILKTLLVAPHMWVSIDLCLVPIGVGVSLSPYIKACLTVIEEHKLEHEIGPNGTAIEGEWDQVFKCVKNCHEVVHSKGTPRVYSTLKINTRTDKKQSFKEKVPSVKSKD